MHKIKTNLKRVKSNKGKHGVLFTVSCTNKAKHRQHKNSKTTYNIIKQGGPSKGLRMRGLNREDELVKHDP